MDFMGLIEIPRVDNVRFEFQQTTENTNNQQKSESIEGSICLTSHHLIFSPKICSDKTKELWIQNALIDSLELKIRETKYQILIKCKDFRIFLIDFPSIYHCQGVHKSLDALSNISSDSMKTPFFSQLTGKINPYDWMLYSTEEDFFKFFGAKSDDSNQEWRISDVNRDFAVCPSYPPRVIVPRITDDEMLVKSSQFRANGRFPILSYYHTNNKSFLLRSSQPLLGSSNRRCKEDETLLKSCLPVDKKGLIFDLRDSNILKAAQSRGGGYETDSNYPLWKRINIHLDRFDQIQVSFIRLVETISNNNVDSFFARLESTGWLFNMRQCLNVASLIAEEMNNRNACVLVHGWDGWDNTLLICSLVQLILDPESRTVTGFEQLIEREWLHAGHPFSKRCSKSAYGATLHKQEAPVFLLFLDCVRQLQEQFCMSFEFNQDLLVFLFDNVYASEYGTFLGNCQKEREQLQLSLRTSSIWTFVHEEENLRNLKNPIYEKNNSILKPNLNIQTFSPWFNLFMRYQKNEKPDKEVTQEIEKLVKKNKEAREKADELRRKFVELQKEVLTKKLVK